MKRARHALAMPLMLAALLWSAAYVGAVTLEAGPYIFSDESGGLRLIAVSGTGTAGDPIVLVEEFLDIAPGTISIRRVPARNSPDHARAAGFPPHLNIEIRAANLSARPWIGFELELEEVRGQPSTYRDGLSFDQISKETARLSSDRFARGTRTFEPGDRVLFWGGAVDADQIVRFLLLITDTSPVGTFYLVQRPQLATARLAPGMKRPASRFAHLDPSSTR